VLGDRGEVKAPRSWAGVTVCFARRCDWSDCDWTPDQRGNTMLGQIVGAVSVCFSRTVFRVWGGGMVGGSPAGRH